MPVEKKKTPAIDKIVVQNDSLTSIVEEIRHILSRYRTEIDYKVHEFEGLLSYVEITAKIRLR